MGRKPLFDRDQILRAVGAEVMTTGALRLERLAQATGASVGSLYHRFTSREALLAEAWLDALSLFQKQFCGDLERDIDDAVLATPRFCRREPHAASLLACCRKAEFVGEATPPDIRRRIDAENEAGEAALSAFARRIRRPLLACRLAVVAYPLAAVRLYLPSTPPPVTLDKHILSAGHAALQVNKAAP
ncbi:MAG: TetR/AcrR family transcriptional regulator [Alphaproteobacteria bacterium]